VRFREQVHRAAVRIGLRGATLLTLGVADALYGASLITSPGVSPNSTMIWFAERGPMPLWVGLWWTVAALCFVHAFRREGADGLGFAAAGIIKSFWVLVCGWGWLEGQVGLGAVGVFFGLGVVVVINSRIREHHDAPAQWTDDLPGGDDQV
jgi:hypothetical protein